MNHKSLERIEAVRRFNRFYTRQIGLLQEQLLQSQFTLSQARVIYELGQYDQITATEIGQTLGMDAGYLSRIVRDLSQRGIVSKERSQTDGRQRLLTLSKTGQEAYKELSQRSQLDVGAMLDSLPEEGQRRLIDAMNEIERIVVKPATNSPPYLLRPHQPGDIGWLIGQHGSYYSTTYGWDETFEGLAAEIAGTFLQNFDPKRERCWVAERDGKRVGAVILLKKTEDTAQLRMLIVKPEARGFGIGKRLVQECTRFARQAGYNKIMLWTDKGLDAARAIYEKEGYQLIKEEPHTSFGHDLIGQIWELELT